MVLIMGLHHSLVGKSSACNAGDLGSIPGLVRYAAEGNGNPLQYSCLENPMDRGAWQATVHGITRVRHNLATKPPPVLIIFHLTLQLFSPHFFNWLGAPGGWPMLDYIDKIPWLLISSKVELVGNQDRRSERKTKWDQGICSLKCQIRLTVTRLNPRWSSIHNSYLFRSRSCNNSLLLAQVTTLSHMDLLHSANTFVNNSFINKPFY